MTHRFPGAVVLVSAFALALGACQPPSGAPPEPASGNGPAQASVATRHVPEAAPVDAPDAGGAPSAQPPLDAPVALPAEFIASTNEPFWQFSVVGQQATLVGPEARRTLVVESNEALFDGRNVIAKDAGGAVTVRVAGRACQDSMSGAWFPYMARLTLEGQAPVLGCARGANDPVPKPQ